MAKAKQIKHPLSRRSTGSASATNGRPGAAARAGWPTPSRPRARRRRRPRRPAAPTRHDDSSAARGTFGAYALDWIASYQGRTSRGLDEGTRADYRRDLERYAIPYFDKIRRRKLGEIQPRDVRAFITWLGAQRTPPTKRHPKGRKLTQGTITNRVAPLKALLRLRARRRRPALQPRRRRARARGRARRDRLPGRGRAPARAHPARARALPARSSPTTTGAWPSSSWRRRACAGASSASYAARTSTARARGRSCACGARTASGRPATRTPASG